MILHKKNQASIPSGFRDFFIISLCTDPLRSFLDTEPLFEQLGKVGLPL